MKNTLRLEIIKKRNLHNPITFYTFTRPTRERIRHLTFELLPPRERTIETKSRSKNKRHPVMYANFKGKGELLRPGRKLENQMYKTEWGPLVGNMHPWESRVLFWTMAVKNMRMKKPKAETIENSESKEVVIPATETSEVRKYLTELNIREVIPEKQKKVYSYIRGALIKSLGQKSSNDPIFGALIERIARTGAYLDLMEESILGGRLPGEITGQNFSPNKQSPYVQIQTEHRKLIETFTNLKFAEEKKKSSKVLEEIRKTVSFEVDDEL